MKNKIGLYQDPRKKKRWVVRWFGEYDHSAGKERRYSKAFKLKCDAEAFQAQKAVEFDQGQRRDKAKDVSLKAFCGDWLKTRKPELRAGSITVYENTIRRLVGYFGPKTTLRQITPRAAAKFIAELRRLDGQERVMSSWSRHRILRNCRTIFNGAVNWELIGTNPFLAVKRPKVTTSHWHYLTPEQYGLLLKACLLRQRAIYALAYTAGLRLGELLSLRWEDIDFDKGEVVIRNRPATAKTPPFLVKDNESRTVPLPKCTLEILSDLKEYNAATDQTPYVALDDGQYTTMLAKWQRYREQGRAWMNKDMQNNTLQKFKRHVKKAGITPDGTLSLHTLRKCCITNWANNINNPEVVRKLAGHSDLKTTMQFYSMTTAEQREKAAAAIDELLAKSDAGVTPGANFGENHA